jgi:hypothetical protein
MEDEHARTELLERVCWAYKVGVALMGVESLCVCMCMHTQLKEK